MPPLHSKFLLNPFLVAFVVNRRSPWYHRVPFVGVPVNAPPLSSLEC